MGILQPAAVSVYEYYDRELFKDALTQQAQSHTPTAETRDQI